MDQEEHTVSSTDPEDVEGGAVHHMDLQCVSMAEWLEWTDQAATSSRSCFWAREAVHVEHTFSIYTAPGLAKHLSNNACSKSEYDGGLVMCVHVRAQCLRGRD